MRNIRVFVSESFQFLEVKFSIYLNRRVFVMNPDNILIDMEREKNALMLYANSKGSDGPAHPCILIWTFSVC